MAVKARLLKGCAFGSAGKEITLEEAEYEYLRKTGYAAQVEYETAARIPPVRRQRGRPKKT
jgi:hypothetical protein